MRTPLSKVLKKYWTRSKGKVSSGLETLNHLAYHEPEMELLKASFKKLEAESLIIFILRKVWQKTDKMIQK